MANFPSGQFTKRNISKEWPEQIVKDHVFPNKKSYKITRR